jgi:hypothetical protein
MTQRAQLSACVASALALAVMHPMTALAQAPAKATPAKAVPAQTRTAENGGGPPPAKTPWGDPDIQGVWTSTHYYKGAVPFERPRALGTKVELTEEELQARLAARAKADQASELGRPVSGTGDDEISPFVKPSRRTSIVFDPPDGRLPPMTPEGQKRLAALKQEQDQRLARNEVSPKLFDLKERCVTRGFPNTMFLNNPVTPGIQIVQGPGSVVVRAEMQSEWRIIRLDSAPSLGPRLRQWWGESRGHWEGDTLVVVTNNFNNRPKLEEFEATGEQLRITERFRRTTYGELQYEYTVDDPTTWTKPWGIKVSWGLNENQPEINEYACHAGNYSMTNMIRGALTTLEKQGKLSK